MKIYKVNAVFEDFESTSFFDIGAFTDKSIAVNTKEKWEHFFKISEDLFKEPEGWDPESDEWYDIEDFKEYGFSWKESYQYQMLAIKYEHIKKFSGIEIEEIVVDEESFIDKFTHYEDMIKLMKEFDRDWKLNKIIK